MADTPLYPQFYPQRGNDYPGHASILFVVRRDPARAW